MTQCIMCLKDEEKGITKCKKFFCSPTCLKKFEEKNGPLVDDDVCEFC